MGREEPQPADWSVEGEPTQVQEGERCNRGAEGSPQQIRINENSFGHWDVQQKK